MSNNITQQSSFEEVFSYCISLIVSLLIVLFILIVIDIIMKYKHKLPKSGLLIRGYSFWIGIHYSKYCKRLCINLIPCLTIWIGTPPTKM